MIRSHVLRTIGPILLLALMHITSPLAATEAREHDALPGYRLPEPAVVELLTAMPPPEPLIHARSSQVALLFRQAVIPLERLSQPRLGLAGYRFDPASQTSGVSPLVQRVEVVDAGTDRRHRSLLWQPTDSYGLDHVNFSSGGEYLSALRFNRDGTSSLTLFALNSGNETVVDVPVNAAYGKPCSWVGPESLLCRVRPQRQQQLSAARPAPLVIEHTDGPAPTRTYNNLLNNAHEDELFEHYFNTELALVSVDGNVRRFPRTRGLISSFDPSADGSLVIIKRLQRPFSRLVPARRFPNVLEVWDLNSGTRLYQSPPSGYGVSREGSAPDRPHRVAWKPGSTNTAGFLRYHDPENVKEEPAKGAAPYRWWSVMAPFDAEPELIASSEKRIERFGWTTAGTPYFFTQADDGGIDTWIVFEDGPQRIWSSGEAVSRYGEAGRAIRQDGEQGPVLEIDRSIYLTGYGNAQSGPQPFLDAYDLRERKVKRLFTAQRGVFEEILAILHGDARSLLTSRETENRPPNLYRIDGDRRTALRPYQPPYPALDNVERQVIRYQRNDGLAMTGTLYLPETWQPGNAPLPTLIWIYPYEFADQEHAERLDVRGYRYHNVKGPSPLAAVLAGYAVLVNPTVPIVGEGDEVNDTYIEQLVASAEAAVDYLVDQRISAPGRIAVGGRSYGAFSSANLMIHSRRFATAIAMSGAYNRTLTPFGFQHEKRSFWDAAEMYTKISPVFHANDIEAPVLLVHGSSDPNPGTPPLQARRFFHALVGEGVPVRYVELPHEAHHYWGRESVLTTAREMIDWLDRTIGRD